MVSIKTFFKSIINSNGKRNVANTLTNPDCIKDRIPFCQEYWKEVNLKEYERSPYKSVTHHGYLNGINLILKSPKYNLQKLKEVFMDGVTPMEIIKASDAEFKTLPKTTEIMKVFRGIDKKVASDSQYYSRYCKSLNVKKGDIIRMPEYAYTTSDMNFAKNYATNSEGILYDIEIPIGARISRIGHGIDNEIVFPRSSLFKCIGKEGKGDLTIIKLRYIKPVDYCM